MDTSLITWMTGQDLGARERRRRRMGALLAGTDVEFLHLQSQILTPEENHRVVEGAHGNIRVMVGVYIQTT